MSENKKNVRPSWDEYFMTITKEVTRRSSCVRRQVGAIIVGEKRILATGYNDTPRGLKNCGEGGCARCASKAPSGTGLDTCLCIHAEQNAIVNAAYHGVSIKDSIIYCTHQPCLTCAKLIINAGIKKIIFAEPYPSEVAEKLLAESKVELIQYKK